MQLGNFLPRYYSGATAAVQEFSVRISFRQEVRCCLTTHLNKAKSNSSYSPIWMLLQMLENKGQLSYLLNKYYLIAQGGYVRLES